MLLYLIAAIFGFVLHALYQSSKPDLLDNQIFNYLRAGRRVIICVDSDATIMTMVDGKLRVSKAMTAFYDTEEVLDNVISMDSNRSIQSTDAHKDGPKE